MIKTVKVTLFTMFVFVMSFIVFMDTGYALDCANYKLATTTTRGVFANEVCYDTYSQAKAAMDSQYNDSLVILKGTVVVDAKYALVDVGKNIFDVFSDSSRTIKITYLNASASDDAAFISYDDSKVAIKLKISGVIGWVDLSNVEVVPLLWVKTYNYYTISDTTISHTIFKDMYGKEYSDTLNIGVRPSSAISNGKYYSYDGKYFYTNIKTLLSDYKNGNFLNSVNPNNPFYNFYQYLSFRTKTTYSAQNINDYMNYFVSSSSLMRNTGSIFIDAQNKFGVNALIMLGIAANESAWGTSGISNDKINLFGLGANDSSPYDSAYSFESIRDCVEGFAYKYMSYKWLQFGDYVGRATGSSLGNKLVGVNVFYAADPYWGEKAAAKYYNLDKYYDYQDYYKYRDNVAVLNTTKVVYARTTASTNGVLVDNWYQFRRRNWWADTFGDVMKDAPIIIVDIVTGDSVDGDTRWYKIMSDATDYTGSSTAIGDARHLYDWNNNFVYVPAAYFTKVNFQSAVSTKISPSTVNPTTSLTNKDSSASLYYYDAMSYSAGTLNISGFLALTGMNNTASDASIKHYMIFKDVNNNTEYYYELNRWLAGYPFEMTNSDESVKYNYSGGWFSGNLDLSLLPEGDYQVYAEATNGSYKVRRIFNNLYNRGMISKVTDGARGYKFEMNYLQRSVPLDLTIRDDGLISGVSTLTSDKMYNSFTSLGFSGNNLNIKGTSHNVGIDYSVGVNVERWLVIENIANYDRTTYSIGSITNGDYVVSLKVSDGKDKTRVWFNSSSDISGLEKGTYAIYIKTKVGQLEDYGELSDLMYKTINYTTTINGKTYTLRRNDTKRFRIELVVS